MPLGLGSCHLSHGWCLLPQLLLNGRDCHRILEGSGGFLVRQGLGMLGLDLDDCSIQLVQLPLEHLLRRPRVHVLQLPQHGAACLVIDLGTHFGCIVRQAVHGTPDNRNEVSHQHFLVVAGTRRLAKA